MTNEEYLLTKRFYDTVGILEKPKVRKTVSHVQYFMVSENCYKLTLAHIKHSQANLECYRVTLKNVYSKNKHNVIYSTFEQALDYYINRQNHLKNYAIEVN